MGLPANITSQGAHPRNTTDTKEPSLKNKILLAIPESELELVHPVLEEFDFTQHSILHEPTHKCKRHPWAVSTSREWVGMMTLVGTKGSVHEGISGHFEAVTKRS